MELGLHNHRILVTGGASGIGLAVARMFANESADVVLWDADEQVEATASELAAETGRACFAYQVDISDQARVGEAIEHLPDDWDGLDHVVHAAAIGSGHFGFPFTNLEPEDWDRVLQVNIRGTVNIAHAVTPLLMHGHDPSLIMIASVAGQIGSSTDPPYSASKAANINFAQCMARDLAVHGIRVNTVCPGMVQTPLNQSVWQAWNARQPDESKQSYKDWADGKIRQIVPLGRWQSPEDIADMIVFLSSGRARNVTGQTINVDGGYVMHW